jgi:hypothetical protein
MSESMSSSASSKSDIVQSTKEILESVAEYSRLKDLAGKSEHVGIVITQLAKMLEDLLSAYTQVVWKYKMLTSTYGQQSKIELRKVSENLIGLLEAKIGPRGKVQMIEIKKYGEIGEEIGNLNKELLAVNQTLMSELKEFERSLLTKTSFSKQIIRIPEVAQELGGTGDLLRCIAKVEEFLSKNEECSDLGKLPNLKRDWSKLKAEFDRYSKIESVEGIQKKYGFSKETMIVIKGLLEASRISLESVSPEIYQQLINFKEFCRAIILEFKH